MITIRPGDQRGHANRGWLDSYHTFSFADYRDANHMGFRDLRVINEDRIESPGGFGMHPHRDMEIVTYIIEGALEHKDSMGNGSVIRKGDIQRMSAGTGITHSEFNHSSTEPVHLLQIWILTEHEGIGPGYEEIRFVDFAKPDAFNLIVSRGGRGNSVHINQDVEIYSTRLEDGKSVVWNPDRDRHTWIQIVSGELELNGKVLAAGDGAGASDEQQLKFYSKGNSEFLLFNLK